MNMEKFEQIRQMAQELKKQRQAEGVDYAELTAPCGLPCFSCYPYLAQFSTELAERISEAIGVPVEKLLCKGCRGEDGQCAMLPMPCRVYACIKKTEMSTCAECDDFPCTFLHPYRDQAEKWHNTKVYNLCRIKKLGLDQWARTEGGEVLDTYFYGAWTL